jgi:hypothetical protein
MKNYLIPVFLLGATVSGSATVLVFETALGFSLSSSDFLSENPYGHRVAGNGQGGYIYNNYGGWTDHISVSYSGNNSTPAGWGEGYGPMGNVLWGAGSSSGVNEVSIHFVADPGFLVEFRELQVARWSNGSYPGSYVTLTDALGTTSTLLENTELDTSLTVLDYNDTPFVSSEFTLTFGQGWWTAIDNLQFSQVAAVPEPASMIALALGAGAVARRRVRK